MSNIVGHVNNERLRPDVVFVPENGIVTINLGITDPDLAFGFESYRVTVATRLPGSPKPTTVDYLVTGSWSDGDAFDVHTILKMELRPPKSNTDTSRMPEFTGSEVIEQLTIVHAINERCQPTYQDPTPPFEDRRPV